MPYLLDADVFIEAKNRYYGMDFCPAFWEWLLTFLQAADYYWSVMAWRAEIRW